MRSLERGCLLGFDDDEEAAGFGFGLDVAVDLCVDDDVAGRESRCCSSEVFLFFA